MSDHNKRILQQWYEMWNTGKTEIADGIVSDNFVDHTTRPHLVTGREALKEFVVRERTGLPDIVDSVLMTTATDEWAVGLYRTEGTHRGEYYGVPPTGRRIDFVGSDIFRVEEGCFVEWWYSDMEFEIYAQLGVRIEKHLLGDADTSDG